MRPTVTVCPLSRTIAITGVLVTFLCAAPALAQRDLTSQAVARIWDAEHVSSPLPPLVDHAEVVRRLDAVVSAAPDLFTLERIGASVEGRSIDYIRVGTGPTGVLLWSQMHGDEPTATSALFDVFGYSEGTLVDLPDWRSRGEVTVAVGQPVRIALLRPAQGGKYRVEVVLR